MKKARAAKRTAKRPSAKKRAARAPPAGRVVVQSVNSPGYRSTVDAAKYEAMRRALFAVLPKAPPGLTQNEMFAAVVPKLPADLFPGGAKAPWWVKCVQLDQEVKGTIEREATKPIRWHRA